MSKYHILLGNEAIAYGLVECSCTLAASYPGTPASEVLSTLLGLKRQHALDLHAEWSVNEKVAFEVALAAAYTGRRAAVIMKQVGLNVAADPLMSAAYTGVKGGFVLVVADDPGPHSSQTEQDSRFYAMMAKLPVLDPTSPAEARQFVRMAYELSEQFEIPVMLRPTTRICHARQDMELPCFSGFRQTPAFDRNPGRWAATPKFRLMLHHQLNEKIESIAQQAQFYPRLANDDPLRLAAERGNRSGSVCILASGVVFAHTKEILADLHLYDSIPLYQVLMPYPLSAGFRQELLRRYDKVLVLEETSPVIELQLQNKEKVLGRTNHVVPAAGELLPEVVEDIVRKFLDLPSAERIEPPNIAGRRPTLCAGCPHRAAFFAIKKAFPKAIYPSDIGCYTLGLNLGAVDTVLCMGAAIGLAAGFYHAYRAGGVDHPPIAATIGDSTFFHAGIPALLNAVVQGTRFVLVVLDNSTTAMTGHQPTPAGGMTVDGHQVPQISIAEIARACGVRFVETADPYRLPEFIDLLKKAGNHTRDADGGIAVVIAKRPCLMDRTQPRSWTPRNIVINDKCKSCDFCIKHFECPALQSPGEKMPVQIDRTLCTGCAVCVHVCPNRAIEIAG
ncbi:indolepyruvate ferredoxin oxidoreductase subunit alpha [Desulfoferrobacter suflitae]|uniref:indolepyruvate ferredoxin oxidoreductase subunit alpha n=1 Tax=Desulfoferrobacter suflitae TaxID=2865782 RepID=UPI0021641A4A|nr:indolepyruvate ferredoxin oxidoreductase subunit alpha [Desulfoferrobacter suflitae]MCK8603815.1 indolepyruvate ferredoxin oxidoreductase subunit alpha [Desulfoferrobacter suflitae]